MATPRPARAARVLLPTLLAALLAGGCAQTVAGTAAPDPAPRPAAGVGADPVAWGGKVCGALLSYYRPLSARPDYGGADLPGIKTRLSEYLGAVKGGIDAGKKQLGDAGAAPITGGDQFKGSIDDLLKKTGTTIDQAKTEVDQADPNDVPGFQARLKSAEEKLRTIGTAEGLDKLGKTPRLDKAVASAPPCVELNELTKPG
ncbi:hypothetical protein [Pseudonocardia sp. HH130630-07]|uniref:hypothetical protein n=1 Tax=Pseudonocardia sp. HH130630-07 TaxID=1690815 RepID=UPI000814D7BE|nr:hypothetical protein [Pseudonocardia sp. HH130630-07]ANY06454.1 hypothetical protein AFB00_09300 [Pseudonocardia sp. HH130630-07]